MGIGPVTIQEVDELEKIYGKRGAAGVVDALGRVNGKTYPDLNDEIPEYLRSSAVSMQPTANRRITILKDHTLETPQLYFKVFVQPDPAVSDDEARFARMFARAGCRRAESVLESDLVVFGGGSDVDPVLYGAERHDTTYPDPKRDQVDMDLYLMCLEHGIPMFGVCRGAQFLHVMNGGKLYQDVDGHYGDHTLWDISRKQRIEKISSVHHQMVMPNTQNGMEIIGTTAKSNQRAMDNKNISVGTHCDIEAFFYRDTGCIGVQGHPEYEGYNFFTKWCLELIQELIQSSPDYAWEGPVHRLKQDLLLERQTIGKFAKPINHIIVPVGKEKK
jgi:gamma-glutamyl-gamma-aminobutyrate hydrolase PuuD